MAETTSRGQAGRPPPGGCSRAVCGATIGYYTGGGTWLCWMHALIVPGALRVVETAKLPRQALPLWPATTG